MDQPLSGTECLLGEFQAKKKALAIIAKCLFVLRNLVEPGGFEPASKPCFSLLPAEKLSFCWHFSVPSPEYRTAL